MLILLLIFCNYLMYIDYFHIQLVFDLVMDLWKVKYILNIKKGDAQSLERAV